MSLELVAIGTITSAAGFGLAFATFWQTLGRRVATAETKAAAAGVEVAEASRRIELMQAAFALHREQVAREYIHREAMREVEDRLTAAIDRLGVRLDRFVETAIKAP